MLLYETIKLYNTVVGFFRSVSPKFRLETCMAKITFMQFFVTLRGIKDEDFVQ